MPTVTTTGPDIVKSIFRVHGIDAAGASCQKGPLH
jgi:hypothetical protein